MMIKPNSLKARKEETHFLSSCPLLLQTRRRSELNNNNNMLNQDLLTEILLRLPIKSLLRFKSVSTHWRSLISSPDFRRRHLASSAIILSQTTDTTIHHTSLHGGAVIISDPLPFTSLNFVDDSAGVKILQSSHGLLLCRSVHKLGKRQSLYICNPSTHQYTVISEKYADDVSNCKPTTLYGAYLVFDPSNSPNHQIVSVRKCLCSECSPSLYDNNISYQIVIYSSESRVWKYCGSAFATPLDMAVDNGVVWNGAIHWISATGASLCFDIGRQCLRTMPSLPSTEKWSRRRMRYFGESGGHLYLIEVYGSAIEFQVFEMEMDYSSWVPKYNVNLAPIVDAYPEMVRSYPDAYESVFYVFSLLCVQDDEEGSYLLLHIPGVFLSYNLRDRTFKKLRPISKETNVASQLGCFQAFQFVETLAGV